MALDLTAVRTALSDLEDSEKNLESKSGANDAAQTALATATGVATAAASDLASATSDFQAKRVAFDKAVDASLNPPPSTT